MAQRRKRHYPALKFVFSLSLFLSIACVLITACQKGLIKVIPVFHPHSVWMWGGDIQRRGQSLEEIRPPLTQVWKKKVNGALDQAIAAADSFLVFGTKAGEAMILNLKSGKSYKSLKIEKNVTVTCLIHDDRLIVAQRWNRPSLQSIDFVTGKTIWKFDQGAIVGEPLLIGDTILAANSDGVVFAVNGHSGTLIWRTRLETPIRSSLAATDQVVTGVSEGGRVWAVSREDGTLLWEQVFQESFQATPVLSDDRLFVGSMDEIFYCLSLADGSEIWRRNTVGSVYLKAALDDETVYVGTTQGICYALDAENGDQRWLYETQSVIGTPPVISGRFLYFGVLDRTLYGLIKKSGQKAWHTEVESRIRTTPLVWQGMLIVSSEDRHVYGYKEDQ
jgi:outer membrane protein assembly factor BamB